MLVLFLYWLHAWRHSALSWTRPWAASPVGPVLSDSLDHAPETPPSVKGSHSVTSAALRGRSESRPVPVQTQQRAKIRPVAGKFQRCAIRSGYSSPPNSLCSVFTASYRQSAMALLQMWKWPIKDVKLQWLDVTATCSVSSEAEFPHVSSQETQLWHVWNFLWQQIFLEKKRPVMSQTRLWDTWLNICICGFKSPLKLKISMSISVSRCLRLLGKLFVELIGNILLQQWLL